MSIRLIVRSNGDRLPEGEFLIRLPDVDLDGEFSEPPTIAWRAESWHVWSPPEAVEYAS